MVVKKCYNESMATLERTFEHQIQRRIAIKPSCERAYIIKRKPRQFLKQRGFVSVTDVAQEVGFIRRIGEEFLVDHRVAEPRHGADIQTQRPRGDHQIGTLQGAISKGGRLDMRGFALEHWAAILMWEKERKMFPEVQIKGDDGGDRCTHQMGN